MNSFGILQRSSIRMKETNISENMFLEKLMKLQTSVEERLSSCLSDQKSLHINFLVILASRH